MKYTIFVIDNHTSLRVMARFLRFVDELRAMGKTNGKVLQCVGSWGGVLEPSFICRTDDFEKHFKDSGYLDQQGCFLQVSECNKQYAQLLFPDGSTEFVGSLQDVSKEEAMKHDGWTYRPDLNTYWVVVQGNPDRTKEEF